jgi:2,3-bisphosphoglycerate-dependent phosphoglycerate mutase
LRDVAESEYRQHQFVVPPDATEIVLARHGASAPAKPGQPFPRLDGHSDPELAPEGLEQAELLCERLRAIQVDEVFVTGLRRTIQTAAPLGRETIEVPELREVNLGDWEGGPFRIKVAERDPLAMRVIGEERWDLIPNAETMQSLAARVTAGIDKVVAATGPGRVAVVFAHGGVIGEVCRQATNSRPFAFVHSDNCSISRLVRFADGRWLLLTFNDTSHLASWLPPDRGAAMGHAAASASDDRQVTRPA